MDLQWDKLSQEVSKFPEGQRVEVRQKDVGLRGSWHPGTVVGLATGRRLVEYDELLTEDGLHKLRESIPCPKLSEVSGTLKVHTLMVTSARSTSKRRGFLRPYPPPPRELSPLTWKAGVFVDVSYQDAWWEAVLLNDVTSLDERALVDVIFPDEGDLARVHVKDMRISQCWDEVSGCWSVKGSIDLSRFLKRRGYGKKEVSLTADSDRRVNEVCSKPVHTNMKLARNSWIQTCPSSVSAAKLQSQSHGSTGFTKVYEESPLLDHHEQVISSCLHSNKSTLGTLTPSREGGLIFDMPEAECYMDLANCVGRHKKVSCEEREQQAINHHDPFCGKNMEMARPGQELVNQHGMAERDKLPFCKDCEVTCFGRKTLDKESNGANFVFKRRKVVKVPSSHVGNTGSKSVISYFAGDSTDDGYKDSSFGIGCHDTTCKITVESNRSVAMKRPSECGSVVVPRERQAKIYSGVHDQNPSRKQAANNFVKGRHLNRFKMGNKALQKRPVCRTFLLALEAPVRKSQDEYEKIMSARKDLLGGVAPGRKRRKKWSAWNLQAKIKRITLAGDKEAEKHTRETVTCPKTNAARGPALSIETSKARYWERTTTGKSDGGRSGLERLSSLGKKVWCVPAQKPSKKVQIVKAGKETAEQTSNERSIGIAKQLGEIVRPAGTTECGVGNDTLRSYKDQLVRQKQAMVLKRKASDLDSLVDACRDIAKFTEVPKLEVDSEEPCEAAPEALSLPDRGDSISAKGKTHRRIRALVATQTAEKSSASGFANCKDSNMGKRKAPEARCLLEQGCRNLQKLSLNQFSPGKGSHALKKKAPKAKCMAEHGGRNVVNTSKVSKAERNEDQAEGALTSVQPNLKTENQNSIDDKSLKLLAREVGLKAIFEAGFTMEYRVRRNESASDAVYTSPQGSSYWSLPKAWQALGNDKKKGRIKVEKAVIKQVFTKVEEDEKYRQAFEKLEKFSGTCIEVMKQANMTYAELTDFLLEDLRVLRKSFLSIKQTKTSSKTSLLGSSLLKKRGRKPKQKVQPVIGKTNHKLSTGKHHSRLKHVQGSSLTKFEKNSLKLIEGASRLVNRSYSRNFRKAALKASTMLPCLSIQRRQNNLKSSSRKHGNKIGHSRMESSKQKDKELKPRSALRLEVRSSSSCVEDVSEELSCQNKRTVLSWMIGRGAVLETERITWVDQMSNNTMKEGVVTREGILCLCCERVYSLKGFADHGEVHVGSPNCKLVFAVKKTLLDCQSEAWNQEIHLRRTQNYKGVSANDMNDDTCLLCGDGGVLLCCDYCPSTFHASCIQLDDVPEGNWYCPNCCCGVCKGRTGIEEGAVCSQCEHKYHDACLRDDHIIHRGQFWCRDSCKKIYSGLKNLIGITHSLGKGFSWTLLHCNEEPQSEEVEAVMETNSKLAVALLVLKECFNPMEDPRTNIDMITHAAYNRRSQFWRLNYVGFHTVVLERDEEIISVASIRIHNAKIAEMPLIGTRHKYRRQGMCRLLVGAIEKLLSSLEVATFILPAIPELYETWTHAFGFRPLDSSLTLEIRDLSMMIFPGTDLLQKSLMGGTAVSSLTSLPR